MWLSVESGDGEPRRVRVAGERFVIGRDEHCDLVLSDSKVSRRHAYLKPRSDGRASLHDLGSSNGTWVDGQAVQSALLGGGERLQVGDTELVPQRSEAPAVMVAPRPALSLVQRGQSALHRVALQRSVRRATVVGAAALAVAASIAFMTATGVFERDRSEEVVRAVAPATVSIEARRGAERTGNGSGWVLDAAAGLVVTNAHVINSGDSFKVGVEDALRDAEVVGAAPCEDLAVLRVRDTSRLRTLALGDQDELRLGELVVAVGYPGSASQQVKLTSTTGVVSVVRSTYREPALDVPVYLNVVQTDAAINPGSSGGPLVNGEGELVGVNSAGRTKAADGRVIQGQSYAVGVDRVKEVAPTLRGGKSIGWSGMGFEYPAQGAGRGPSGLLVAGAVRGTAAARAGFGRSPLVVTAIDGNGVDRSIASYCDAVRGIGSGDSATFTVVSPRGGRPRELQVAFE